ncbi:MAG: hypothetical protein A4E57_00994 [Syntrophorhabdaceae bacterium PtaU1.Bin034]|jgi:uncharacterized membrane protein (UPF0127 family)|nr:MAG: hypothetical protein A4E57_00994 [Syntrophorhabdaceae bacterium PtaU1.Bin034]
MHRHIAKWGVFVATAILFSFLSHAFGTEPTGMKKERLIFSPARVSVIAEKADSPDTRARGLMFRKSLGEKEAMIFYFEEPGYLSFWMRNTLVPLTVIFLDESFRIVDMQDMSPCLKENPDLCPVYVSRSPARYAVEVNQGFAVKHRIKTGDRVTVEKDVKRERVFQK